MKFNAKSTIVLTIAAVLFLAGGLARAVRPGEWNFHSEADFAKCQRESTVVNSHGDVTLARKIEIVLASADAPAVVSAVAVDGDTIYAASGTTGWIYKITPAKAKKQADEKARFEVKKFAEIPSAVVTCLVRKGRTLLAGGGGEGSGIYSISPAGKVEKVFAQDVAEYVWAIAWGKEGVLYAATGPEGIVYAVDKSGKGEVLYHIDKKLAKNILCLALGNDGKVLAGTDTSGLVIEIDPARKVGRVILDAAEREISAIVPDGAGGVFVATSDIAKAGKASKPTGGKNGKAASRPTTKPTTMPAPKQAKKTAAAKTPTSQPSDKKKKAKVKSAKPVDKSKSQRLNRDKLPAKQSAKKLNDTPPRSAKQTGEDKTTAGENADNGNSNGAPANDNAKPKVKMPANALAAMRAAMKSALKAKRPKPSTAHKPKGKGNAVYHIDTRGMVRTLFRKPVTILAMVAQGDRLILATGNEGKIYYVTADGDLNGELVDTDAEQVTALVETPAGELVFATSNTGSVGKIAGKFAAKGTLISKPSDAKQIAQWGTIKLRGVVPESTGMTVATRSGNVAKADDATWSSWSKDMPLARGYLPIGSPAGRFLQYRVTFTSNGGVTPSLGSVDVIYQVGNLAPAVLGVEVKPSSKGAKPTQKSLNQAYRLVAIQALDPNSDKLKYTVDFRLLRSARWVQITDSLTKSRYVWDTRTVADGLYEMRVTASDSPSNIPAAARQASRVSEPVTVDNTPPTISGLTATVAGDKVVVTGQADDAMSRIVLMQYAVDSVDKWQAILPSDGICDSPSEAFRFEASADDTGEKLKPGPHNITVRATDKFGNTGYGSLNVTVGK